MSPVDDSMSSSLAPGVVTAGLFAGSESADAKPLPNMELPAFSVGLASSSAALGSLVNELLSWNGLEESPPDAVAEKGFGAFLTDGSFAKAFGVGLLSSAGVEANGLGFASAGLPKIDDWACEAWPKGEALFSDGFPNRDGVLCKGCPNDDVVLCEGCPKADVVLWEGCPKADGALRGAGAGDELLVEPPPNTLPPLLFAAAAKPLLLAKEAKPPELGAAVLPKGLAELGDPLLLSAKLANPDCPKAGAPVPPVDQGEVLMPSCED